MIRTRIGGSKHALAALAAVLALACAPASAAAPPAWSEEASSIAAQWPSLQEADGRFRDYVLSRDPSETRDDYGEPMLGYALLLTADRTADGRLAEAGLRALEHSLDRAARGPSTRVFHLMAVASAYNLARERFPSHPVFQRARPRWEDVLREVEIYRIGTRAVTNKSIVEAVLLLELTRSGLRSSRPGTALHDPAATRTLVWRFLARDLPRASVPFERGGRAVIGDAPALPPSYHALSVGMLARAIALLDDEAPRAARSLLRRTADASVALAAPDGSVAYHGRSQEQAWTLSHTAYGAELAALQPGASRRAPAYRGLSRRVLARLADAYGSGPEGFLITPALAQDIDAAIPGLDEYVAAASYVGLTLSALEWAIATAGDGPAGRIGADSPRAFVLGRGPGSWAVARSGEVWFAVRRARSSIRDPRYDVGLMAVKVRRDGEWRDALPLRPRSVGRNPSAGPSLRHGRAWAMPEMTELEVEGRRIVGRGGFRTDSGAWARRGVTFTFAPVACGVRLSWRAQRSDRYRYLAFFRTDWRRSGRTVVDGMQAVVFGSTPSLAGGELFTSSSEIRLIRARAIFTAKRPGRAAIEVCAR
jgi:hypothetical protein